MYLLMKKRKTNTKNRLIHYWTSYCGTIQYEVCGWSFTRIETFIFCLEEKNKDLSQVTFYLKSA